MKNVLKIGTRPRLFQILLTETARLTVADNSTLLACILFSVLVKFQRVSIALFGLNFFITSRTSMEFVFPRDSNGFSVVVSLLAIVS